MKTLAFLLLGITILTKTLPSGQVGKPYTARVWFKGGQPPYNCASIGLPPGLKVKALTASTGAHYCLIWGKPTQAGTYGGIKVAPVP